MEHRLRRIRRPAAVAAAVLAVGIATAAWLGPPWVERAIRARLDREAAQRGLASRVEAVRVRAWPPLVLEGLRVEKSGAFSLAVDRVEVTLRPWGRGLLGRTRLALGRTRIEGPGGLALEAVSTRWDVVAVPPDGRVLELREPATGLWLDWVATPEGGRLEVRAEDLPAGRLFSLVHGGLPRLDAGIADGTLRLALVPELVTFDLDVRGRGVRLAALGDGDPGNAREDPFGLPTDLSLGLAGSWRRTEGVLVVPRWRLATAGAAIAGSLVLADLPRDPRVELSLEAERVDFARLLGSAGLDPPEALAGHSSTPHPIPPHVGGGKRSGSFGSALATPAAEDTDGLGSASLSARIGGRLLDPASFTVSQRLDFTPPSRPLPALERLRGDFVHEVEPPGGERRALLVSPASPDFIPLAAVPPLFVQTLLLGEDAGFYNHRGIDLSELPSAVLVNWSRGGPARGASTITQQLAKNLFLSREKRLGRKLQELSLALLLEATLDKQRILEIYLNVIEWGPDLYGLRPAARRYFSREPGDLTPRQMAFLVALVPGPLKYQRSLAGGTPSPGFLPLVDNLLAKLRAADALTEDEYQAALAEELRVRVDPCPQPAP